MQHLSMAHLVGLLFLACLGSSRAQMSVRVRVRAGAALEVSCRVGAGAAATWRRGGEVLSARRLHELGLRSEERADPRGAGVLVSLRAARADTRHAGVYSCGGADPATIVEVLQTPTTAANTPTGGEAGAGGGGAETGAGAGVVYYEVGQPHVELACSLPALQPDANVVWSKNGTVIVGGTAGRGGAGAGGTGGATEEGTRWRAGEGGRLRLSGRAHEDDYGNYSCALDNGDASAGVELRARTIAKLPANTNVVEGQKLKLSCKLLGRPYQPVTWLFANNSLPETDYGHDAVTALNELGVTARLQVSEGGAEDGELVVEAAAKALAGRYTCYSGEGNRNATTTLRVKDMYAALWPFLGIVLEVVILCSVIAVYERRRTKPDLADSDTDTPNQKKS